MFLILLVKRNIFYMVDFFIDRPLASAVWGEEAITKFEAQNALNILQAFINQQH